MNIDVIYTNGHGIYVCAAFIFSFILCLGLFLKTKKVLKKLESEFKIEADHLSSMQIQNLKNSKIAKEILAPQTKAH
tara:strand:+ start:9096 stop:9326 length:231 start_codon:yes stop_codon:yes gene_type:complete